MSRNLYFEGALYAFGGLGVYASYGYSTQVIEWYTVYNTQVSGERIIGQVKFIFIKQRESFFYGITTSENKLGSYRILSRERALIQMTREWKVFKTLHWGIDPGKLQALAKEFTSKTICETIQALCL